MQAAWETLLGRLNRFAVTKALDYAARGPYFGTPHSHENVFHLCYTRAGGGQIVIHDKTYSIGKDDCVFVRPRTLHASLNDRRAYYEMVDIKFRVETPEDEMCVPQFPPVTRVRNVSVFYPAMERLVNAYLAAPIPENWLARIRLVEALLLLSEDESLANLDDAPSSRVAAAIHLAAQYMSRRFADRLTLRDLAEQAGLSVGHFCVSFKRIMGVSPIEFLIQRRLFHAKELLLHSPLTVSEIASVCGFSSPYYFGRLFARKEGISPGRYRKKGKDGTREGASQRPTSNLSRRRARARTA